MSNAYDLIVIGGGPAGYIGAVRAAQLGLRTALVERDKLGGICTHWGCIPTKVLLHTAELVERLKHAEALGLDGGPLIVNYERLQQRKAEVVERIHRGVQYLMRKHKIDVFYGTGRFERAGRVAVALNDGSETVLDGAHVLVATGSVPRGLPGLPVDNRRILDSSGALLLAAPPRAIVIVGSGAVGVEFASLFAALGSQVTLVELLPTLLPLEDEEIGRGLERVFTRKGIAVHTGTTATRATPRGDRLAVALARGDQTQEVEADYVLVAVGRAPLVEGLQLEAAGVAVEQGAIVVDEAFRTSVPTVYAVGDCIARPYRLAHVASDEAMHAVETIAGVEHAPVNYQAVPRPTFSIPQVATVGLSERQATEAGYDVRVGRFVFQANSKAVIEGERDGFVKIVTDARTGEVLGVHMLGPAVTELLAEGVAVKYLEGTAVELGGAVHSHPTLSEAVREAALDALGRVLNA
ncbi:MAG: dihydrolipoyl dehydrogenase [Armatimonadota bacterium]|nr:dihydrolipoyl dehydrogenase [Armatimonadota bacterium]MDR7533450.1 dihydrolipoyl dehydrogenase [Armatimonadota bacterium]